MGRGRLRNGSRTACGWGCARLARAAATDRRSEHAAGLDGDSVSVNAPRHARENVKDPRRRVVVIGAGIGGLTTAAILAQAGLDVTVLEAHVYPGGCAGTFYHQGYRFDVGATLAGGFYAGGPMDQVAQATGVRAWPAHVAEPAMVVHLPSGQAVTRWGDQRRWLERAEAFGDESRRFWEWPGAHGRCAVVLCAAQPALAAARIW